MLKELYLANLRILRKYCYRLRCKYFCRYNNDAYKNSGLVGGYIILESTCNWAALESLGKNKSCFKLKLLGR